MYIYIYKYTYINIIVYIYPHTHHTYTCTYEYMCYPFDGDLSRFPLNPCQIYTTHHPQLSNVNGWGGVLYPRGSAWLFQELPTSVTNNILSLENFVSFQKELPKFHRFGKCPKLCTPTASSSHALPGNTQLDLGTQWDVQDGQGP